jgi:hypothetical protein
MNSTCTGCKWHGPSRVYRDDGACYRRKTYASGSALRPGADGFSIYFETGHIDIYEGRATDDNCGPDRRNYEAKL